MNYAHFALYIRRDIWNNMNRQTYDRSGYYLIVLTNPSTEPSRVVEGIFRDCWADHMANVNVLMQNAAGDSAILYTYFPYTTTHCGQTIPMIVLRFTANSSSHKIDYFPNKFNNLFKCNLTGTMAHFRPYAIYEKDTNRPYAVRGLEIDMLQGVADQLNFSLVIYPDLRNRSMKDGNDISLGMVRLL